MPWSHIEHKVLSHLKKFDQKSLLLAVSGGLDSMVLLDIFLKLQPLMNLHLVVGHVHHGLSTRKASSPSQGHHCLASKNSFRQRAQNHVLSLTQAKGLQYVTNLLKKEPGTSEAEMRYFRYHHLDSWAREMELIVTTAHHSDDLLETQLLRLIRGTGPHGLKAMSLMESKRFRPLLDTTRCELEQYAQNHNISFLEDPSNDNNQYLRNWLRHTWFPLLEQRSPGSLKSLSRSLRHISQAPSPNLKKLELASHCVKYKDAEGKTVEGLSWSSIILLPLEDKASVLAQFMRSKGMKNYGQTHINEVLKRLSQTPTKSYFSLLQHQWTIDRGRISAQPLQTKKCPTVPSTNH